MQAAFSRRVRAASPTSREDSAHRPRRRAPLSRSSTNKGGTAANALKDPTTVDHHGRLDGPLRDTVLRTVAVAERSATANS